mgnify:FL=1
MTGGEDGADAFEGARATATAPRFPRLLAVCVLLMGGIMQAGQVLFIPGWLRCHAKEQESFKVVKECFPDDEVTYCDWEGNSLVWTISRGRADQFAADLENRIAEMQPEDRAEVTLVGHSLGGRIAVRVMAGLARREMKLRQGILLGAAIPYDDKDVMEMPAGSSKPVMNICNPKDVLLAYGYAPFGGEMTAALGSGGMASPLPENYAEYVVPDSVVKDTTFDKLPVMDFYVVRRIANHHAKFYATCLRNILEGRPLEAFEPMVLQDMPNLPMKVLDKGVFWKNLSECKGWKLQQNRITGHCRILTPERVREAWGGREEMEEAFKKIRDTLR